MIKKFLFLSILISTKMFSQSIPFRLQPITKKNLPGFETEGCIIRPNLKTKDIIFELSYNGLVAVQINNKILFAEYNTGEDNITRFKSKEFSGALDFFDIIEKRDNGLTNVSKAELTIKYKSKIRKLPVYCFCDNY